MRFRGGPVRPGVGASVGSTLLVFGLCFPSAGAHAQADKALSLMEEAGSRYGEVQEFCAQFQQELAVPLLNDTTRSQGSLCQRHPDLFAMRFSDPPGDALVADGEFFWVYYPSSDPRQVLRFSLEQRPGGADFYREFMEDPGEKYELDYIGEEVVEGRSTHLISAKPLGKPGFVEAWIWLEADRLWIRRVRIGMENGSMRTVTLRNLDLDPPSDPERFVFMPPPGAQVIRRLP